MIPLRLASGITLRVWDSGVPPGGVPDAPALIFLHGFPENHRTWRHQIAHLSSRYRCVAPDQRGYGLSDQPEGTEAYATERLVADVFELADALGIGRFVVLGHDWGGVITWGVATLAEERIAGAVIANAPHPAIFQRLQFTDTAQRQASQYVRAFRNPANDPLVMELGLGAVLLKGFGGVDLRALPEGAARQAALAKALADPRMAALIDPSQRETLLGEWRDPATARAMLNWYRASALAVPAMDEPFVAPSNWPPPPDRIEAPTLVLWGMDDNALLPANLDGLAEICPNLTLQRLPGIGHFTPWQAPDEVNAALDEFLGELEKR